MLGAMTENMTAVKEGQQKSKKKVRSRKTTGAAKPETKWKMNN